MIGHLPPIRSAGKEPLPHPPGRRGWRPRRGCRGAAGRQTLGLLGSLVLLLGACCILWAVGGGAADRGGSGTREHLDRSMEAQLDRLERLHSPTFFFHCLFADILRRADRAAKPQEYLRKAFANVRRTFGNRFRFMVWDEQGKVVSELTDRGGLRAALQRAWKILKSVRDGALQDPTRPPLELPGIAGQEGLLKGLFGKFLVVNQLNWSYRRDLPDPLPVVDKEEANIFFWHKLGKRIGFAAFIDSRAWDLRQELALPIRMFNERRHRPEFLLGLVQLPTHQGRPLPPFPGATASSPIHTFTRRPVPVQDLLAGATRAEGGLFFAGETPRGRFRFRPLDLGLVAFAFQPASHPANEWSFAAAWPRAGVVSLALLFLGFALRTVVGANATVLPLRWMIASLFLLAAGLPLGSLWFWGEEFFRQTEASLLDEAQHRAGQILRNFDNALEGMCGRYERQGLALVERFSGRARHGPLTLPEITDLVDGARRLQPDELHLIHREAGLIGRLTGPWKGRPPAAEELPFQFARNLLQMIATDLATAVEDLGGPAPSLESSLAPDPAGVANKILAGYNQITTVKIRVDQPSKVFLGGLTPAGSRLPDHVMMLTWGQAVLAEAYLRSSILTAGRNALGMRILARQSASGLLLGPPGEQTPAVEQFLAKVQRRRSVLSQPLTVRGRRFLAVGFPGILLERFTLVGLVPLEPIEAALSGLQSRMSLFGGVMLALMTTIGWFLGRQMLAPVQSLTAAVRAIERRSFDHRVPRLADDEMGLLANTFNHLLEGLEDLAVARAVQESLFPAESWQAGCFSVCGHSTAMGEVGGDYFDLFPLGQDRLAVVLGDVAGHGVPAALVMALAKAQIAMAGPRRGNPAEAVVLVHEMLTAAKSRETRRMMTFLYLILDGRDGTLELCNAGHTSPVLIRAGADRGEFLEVPGMPLGIVKKPVFGQARARLEPGDGLLLYTDGLVEAHDQRGEPFGYPALERFGPRWIDPDPRTIVHRIQETMAAHQGSREPEDDLTVIAVVRRSEQSA